MHLSGQTTDYRGKPLVYEVNDGKGEYGTFYIEPFVTPAKDPKAPGTLGIRLTANTSFGVVGHVWSNFGKYDLNDWPTVLAGLGKDYLLGKLYVGRDREFDVDGTLARAAEYVAGNEFGTENDESDEGDAYVREAITILQSEGTYSATLLDLAGEIEDVLIEDTEADTGSDTLDWLIEILEHCVVYKTASEAEGFWRDLWPVLMTELGMGEKFKQTLIEEARLLEQIAANQEERKQANNRPRPV